MQSLWNEQRNEVSLEALQKCDSISEESWIHRTTHELVKIIEELRSEMAKREIRDQEILARMKALEIKNTFLIRT